MAKSNLRLDTRRALKDGTYPVQVTVGFGTNLYLSTGVYIKFSRDKIDAANRKVIDYLLGS